jgi:hypothetical protein
VVKRSVEAMAMAGEWLGYKELARPEKSSEASRAEQRREEQHPIRSVVVVVVGG